MELCCSALSWHWERGQTETLSMWMRDLYDEMALVSVFVIVREIDTRMHPPMNSNAQALHCCYAPASFLAVEYP